MTYSQTAYEHPAEANLVIDYYTDPLCRRSWAFEPHWRRLLAEFGHRFSWRYRLSGLILGQACPPTGSVASSYVACLAVQCAGLQSAQAGDLYLQAVRVAALQEGQDIAQPQVLASIAEQVAAQVPGLAGQLPPTFNAAAFHQAFAAQVQVPSFANQSPQAAASHWARVPSLVLRRAGQSDYTIPLHDQPYETFLLEVAKCAPDIFYVASLEEGGAG